MKEKMCIEYFANVIMEMESKQNSETGVVAYLQQALSPALFEKKPRGYKKK